MVPLVWTILEEFGYNHILQELNGDHVNRLENVMTLAKDVHSDFDALAIWLVPSDDPNAEPNTYKVESSLPFLLQAYPRDNSIEKPGMSLETRVYWAPWGPNDFCSPAPLSPGPDGSSVTDQWWPVE
ncbi:hypothetical protein CC1G_12866 [Coprinopsis cinerea okayama7|uniref:HNH nuclease domain-containing protein n=1 Tax=Coprinopsis cinerea (strain Okayama-7 / 130 / ATCC MYA-4618 / FGSC 9003) TaxID=240176 RepID=A8P8E8_COPC7|nr:hypothetical protein CC1G_12866 [Coprinopsis cinerea okayama7\|eukprot:XP_001839555.2 hypothetical protein CC1G_12866 [Coprinopsis cinerea okayama7\